MSDTPLEHVSGWTPDQIARLKQVWITTAEQVVALAATPGGETSLAKQLAMSNDECRVLISSARSKLPATVVAEMEKPVDARNRGIGALDPRLKP